MPDAYFVYTPETSQSIIIRAYIRSTMFKGAVDPSMVIDVGRDMLDLTIRGTADIINTEVVKMIRHKVESDGRIARDDNIWGIRTTGTNLAGILCNKYVDKLTVQTDAIQETYRILGVEAARTKIISRLRELVSCNYRHYTIYADMMTMTGNVTSIEPGGMKARDPLNVFLRVGFSDPISVLTEAVLNNITSNITGVTGQLLVGGVPKYGTLYNQYYVNPAAVKKYVKRPDDYLEDLY
jgi:hypothetical protein